MAQQNTTGGISTLGMLLVLFVGLKLCEIITWSWWWVLSPAWLPAAVVLAFGLVILAGVGIFLLVRLLIKNVRILFS